MSGQKNKVSKCTGSWNINRLLHAIYEACGQGDYLLARQKDKEAVRVKDNPPQRIRYERVVAVMRAYNIQFDEGYPIESFLYGEENLNMQLSKADILQMMQPIMDADSRQEKNIRKIIDKESDNLELCISNLYRGLVRYRTLLEKAAYFGRGTLECGSGAFLSIAIKNHFSDKYIKPNLKHIDDVIIKLIKGDFRTITEAELIEQYNYPNVSDDELSDMDMDWY